MIYTCLGTNKAEKQNELNNAWLSCIALAGQPSFCPSFMECEEVVQTVLDGIVLAVGGLPRVGSNLSAGEDAQSRTWLTVLHAVTDLSPQHR